MCLLMTGTSAKLRATILNTEGMAASIYNRNSDGIGAMYTTSRHQLRTPKIVAKNLDEFRAFISRLPDDNRTIAIHARMKTHGDINLDNCHPYPVVDGKIALMHNGVLRQGNDGDRTKSDTWHYIMHTVRPQLELAPTLFTLDAWLKMLEQDIGSGNRFAIMDNMGNLSVANKHTGVEHDGMWFSNTYAWNPALLIPGRERTTPRRSTPIFDDDFGFGSGVDWNNWPSSYPGARYSGRSLDVGGDKKTDPKGNVVNLGGAKVNPASAVVPLLPRAKAKATAHAKAGDFIVTSADGKTKIHAEDGDDPTLQGYRYDFNEDDVWAALYEADPDQLERFLIARTAFTLRTMLEGFYLPLNDTKSEMGLLDGEIAEMLVNKDQPELFRMATTTTSGLRVICEVACWYGEWLSEDPNDAPDGDDTVIDADAVAGDTIDEQRRIVLRAAQAVNADAEVVQAISDMDDDELREKFFPTTSSVSVQMGHGTPMVAQVS